MKPFQDAAKDIIEAGKVLYAMGMVPATSGNFSMRVEGGNIAVTVSGRHKGQLTADDVMLVDMQGQALDDRRPSAETGLHTQIYQHMPHINAILHPHAMNAIVLARRTGGDITLSNYELLKALKGITTHRTSVYIPVFENDQDIPRLAAKVQTFLDDHPQAYAYIIDGHGFYTWGETMADALRHVEALDYLFATELNMESTR
mgnify:CR=1 FL=1